jgi:hypothetical protein
MRHFIFIDFLGTISTRKKGNIAPEISQLAEIRNNHYRTQNITFRFRQLGPYI